MIKKAISFILVLAMALGVCVLSGCGGNDKSDQSVSGNVSDGGVDVEGITKNDVRFLNEDGSSVYRIVRSDGDSDMTAIASVVFKQLKDALGTGIKNVLDSEDGTDMYEILIGDTNRPESQAAMDYLLSKGYGRYNDYIICTMGKKIVVNGMSVEAIENAANYFLQNIVKPEGVTGGIEQLYATEGDFAEFTINGNALAKYKLIWDTTTRSWLISEEVRKVQEHLKDATGYYLPLREDTKTEASEYEISVGNTVRAVKPQSDYSYSEWEILVSGKKVYIMGGSAYAIQVAVTEFGKMLEKGSLTDADSKTGTYEECIASYDSSTYYTLKWCDEFDGQYLDTSKWSHPTDSREDGNMVNDDTTVYFKDGAIVMLGGRRDNGTYYHCSGIQTGSNMSFNFGYLEMRAKIPDGTGVYSSFWSNGGGLEIDIFESLGVAHIQRANIHYWKSEADGGHTSLDGGLYGSGVTQIPGSERQYVVEGGTTLFDQYRTVGLYWTPEEITFIYDGEVYYTQPSDEYHLGKYQSLLAGFNIGWPDRTAPAADLEFPLEYHIDYIRLFQIDGQGLKTK